MTHPAASALLLSYGLFLILCGIISVALIGMKAKTALASGGISGASVIGLSHLIDTGANAGYWGGLAVCGVLFCVFSWRSTKTLFAIFDLITAKHPDLKGKAIAFLIISLMAVMSLVVLLLLIVL